MRLVYAKRIALSLHTVNVLQMEVMLGCLSCAQLLVTPRTVARQAPPSMGFSKQEFWSGLPFPSPEDIPDPEIEPESPALWVDSVAWKEFVFCSHYSIPILV